jgi:spore germination protein YaaH
VVFAAIPIIAVLSVCKGAPWIIIGETPVRWVYAKCGALPPERARALGETAQVLCYAGASIRSDGRIFIREDTKEIASLVATGKKVYLLITPYSRSEGEQFLRNIPARAGAARELVKICDARGLSGMHLDFEFFHYSFADDYADFAMELRKVLDGRDLSVAVYPPLGMSSAWNGMYNLEALSKTDSVVMMCYDLHNRRSGKGPVTDLKWAEENVVEALKKIPAEKLWLGVPLYGYMYDSQGRGSYVTMKKGMEYLSRATPRRLPGGVLHAWIRLRGEDFEIFVPDRKTIRELEKLSIRYRLAGVAYWRTGFETDGFWSAK